MLFPHRNINNLKILELIALKSFLSAHFIVAISYSSCDFIPILSRNRFDLSFMSFMAKGYGITHIHAINNGRDTPRSNATADERTLRLVTARCRGLKFVRQTRLIKLQSQLGICKR